MKNFLFLFLIILISCGEKQDSKADPMKPQTGLAEDIELSGSYFIKQLGNEDVSSEEIDLNFDEKRKELRGNAGCNRFSASFEKEGNKVKFSDPVGTRMFCDGKMERENQVMELLPKIAEMRENENNVIFLSNEGEQLLTVQKNDNE